MTLSPIIKPRSAIKVDLGAAFARAGVTNFNTGGVSNTLIEPIGDVQGDLYDFGLECLKAGMPDYNADATDGSRSPWVDLSCRARKVYRLAAVKTKGMVTLSRRSAAPGNIPIAAGKTVSTAIDTAGRRLNFLTTQDYALGVGETEIEVEVEAEVAGAAYNVPAGAINSFTRPIAGIDTVTNAADWITSEGADQETDARMWVRYHLAWDEMATGSPPGFYLKLALDDIRVAVAWVDANGPRGKGTINIYILGTGGLPSAGLIADVQEYVDGLKAAGSDVLVLAPAYKTVDMAFKIVRYKGSDQTAVEASALERLDAYFDPLGNELYTWIRPLGVGRKVVFSQLVEIITRDDDDAVYDVIFADPVADVPMNLNELPVLGTITVTHEEIAL